MSNNRITKISKSTFTITANGFADGPAQALRDYLLEKKTPLLIEINHPLVPEGSNVHKITYYENGTKRLRRRKFFHRPPITYAADPFIPIRLPADTVWFGFNNLACLRGMMRKKLKRSGKVVYWAVDFVPNRFGNGVATKIYDMVDRFVTQHADARIELSQAALDGRTDYHKLKAKTYAPAYVVPMGAWLGKTPKVTKDNWDYKKIIYLGHLVERQGVSVLIRAFAELLERMPDVKLEIIGSGPLEAKLKQLVIQLNINESVTFHGFVKEHHDVETILSQATIAAAPYKKDPESFTQFADPGKLKAYLGAGLPIVLTNVPPNAQELNDEGAALLVEDDKASLAAGLESLLTNKNKWNKAHGSAMLVAQKYDWEYLLKNALSKLGLT